MPNESDRSVRMAWELLLVDRQDAPAGGHTGTCGHEDVLDVRDLVVRSTADLAHALGDAVHAVQVGLAELPAVGVDRQPTADLDVAARHEVLGLAALAEAELLELLQDERGE